MNRLKNNNESYQGQPIHLYYYSGLTKKIRAGINLLKQRGMGVSVHSNGNKVFLIIKSGKNLTDYIAAIETFLQVTNKKPNVYQPEGCLIVGDFPERKKACLENLITQYIK